MGLNEFEAIARRTMTLFFVIDKSGSMYGEKMGAVNTAIEEVLPELKKISDGNSDAEIKVAFLTFSTGAEWLYEKPLELDQCHWSDIEADGGTDFGAACNELNKKLSTSGFMAEAKGSYAPAIFLMSDGYANDDYISSLNKLRSNNWFKHAIRVAVGYGDDADYNMLAEFTGTAETVIKVHDPESLKKWIKFVSVRASQVASQSSSASSSSSSSAPSQMPSKQMEMASQIHNQVADSSTYNSDDGEW